ncbi:MAG: DNA-3-methyladenine glycosylase I [Alphaproteobacteria bacterium]|nr:DNA-3-methyladenine glycosylase I [Alphaproteobacteria bacterium]
MIVIPFEAIEERARERVGGFADLAARLPRPKSGEELRAIPDDCYLSRMSRRILEVGCTPGFVDANWPAIEDRFMGFNPKHVQALTNEELDAGAHKGPTIGNQAKLRSIRDNAKALLRLVDGKRGMGSYIADWPTDDIVGLWSDLATRFARMGGKSAPYFMRMVGKDTFILTDDVIRALNHWDAFMGNPQGKGARSEIQRVFNSWMHATSRPLCQISVILAHSCD